MGGDVVTDAVYAAAIGADPERAVAGAEDVADGELELVEVGDGAGDAFADEVEALGGDPDVAAGVAGDSFEVGVAAFGQRDEADGGLVEADEAGLGADPDLLLIVLEEGEDGVAGEE